MGVLLLFVDVKGTNVVTSMMSTGKLGPCIQRDEAEACLISLVIRVLTSVRSRYGK
jgi:hypothetical protein